MRILIPVFFKAPLGGLQSHVRAHVDALLEAGHDCAVMCKPGPFADSLRRRPIQVLTTTFEDVEEAVRQAEEAGPYTLVHAHPFGSRRVGLELARRQRIPLVLTLHGTYTDSLPDYAGDVSLLLAVSPAIRDYLLQKVEFPPERVLVTPNGVDTRVFQPTEPDWKALAEHDPALAIGADSAARRVFFVSRLDPDKSFILDVVGECWQEMVRRRAFELEWWVAGDGTLRRELETQAARVNAAAGRRLIVFLGWLSESALALCYNACHLAIAPGRSALEAMACGKPTIAIGSKGYVGLVDSDLAPRGAYTNFGGFGAKHEDYAPGTLFHDIERVIYDEDERERLGRLSQAFVDAFFRQSDLDQQILRVYGVASRLGARRSRRPELRRVACPALAFADAADPQSLAPTWHCPPAEGRWELRLETEGQMHVRYRLPADDKFYITTESARFNLPPRDGQTWRLDPDCDYEFTLLVSRMDGPCSVTLWIIQYDDTQRLDSRTLALRAGLNRLSVRTLPTTTRFRAALRFAGAGEVVLRPITMATRVGGNAAPPSGTALVRAREIPSFGRYQGENLIFIVGPPRSGTTWVLNLLRAHPDVVAATVDTLAARTNDNETLETNIFNDNRPFTDAQIKYRFYCLSRANPGCVIVEKTPVHLLFVERIRRVFPRAALLLTERDGRDVVTSLVHVGRDGAAWWRGAPATVERAASLWKKYAEAALRCQATFGPLTVRYESLLHDPHAVVAGLMRALGMSTGHVAAQVESCHGGKNIPIAGVFREGKSGGWRRLFTEEDVATLKNVTGDLLIRMGYERDANWSLEPATPGPGPASPVADPE
jgi:glycosyltransferase involved in cell wall biosynthesis